MLLPGRYFMFRIALICLAATPAVAQLNATAVETNAFLASDRNRDGVLTRSEFRSFVLYMAAAGQPTARQIKFFGAYAYAFSIADRDRNGIVTPMEMRSADNNFRAGN